jgi:hypothetical protein
MSVQEAAAAEPSPFQTVKGAQPLPGVKLVYYTRATTVRISGDMHPAQLTFAFGRGRLVWMQVAVPDVPFRTVVHMILDTYDVSLTNPTDPYGLPIIKLQDAQGNILGVAPLKGTTWDSSGARVTYLWGVFKRETGVLTGKVARIKDTGAYGLYGPGGWQPAWLPLFRRAGRVYVALDRDATDRAIALARKFGTRGRVLIPPEDLGPKGDLNDWLRVGAKGDPVTFRSILERALATSPTPWVLQTQRLPPDLAPWDLEDYPGVRDLLCELGHQGVLSRDAHLRLLAERRGVALTTLQEAAREFAQGTESEPVGIEALRGVESRA